jgi:hypothetical protein
MKIREEDTITNFKDIMVHYLFKIIGYTNSHQMSVVVVFTNMERNIKLYSKQNENKSLPFIAWYKNLERCFRLYRSNCCISRQAFYYKLLIFERKILSQLTNI